MIQIIGIKQKFSFFERCRDVGVGFFTKKYLAKSFHFIYNKFRHPLTRTIAVSRIFIIE